MTPQSAKFVRSGKVKDIYELDSGHLVFHFTDRVSAFDVILPSMIPRKGEVLCRLGAYWFETLGVKNHMTGLEGKDRMVVKKLQMIPIESVVRGYLYGSLYERVRAGEVRLRDATELAAELPEPYFDPTTKSDIKDVPITESEILEQKRMTKAELEEVRESSISIYRNLAGAAKRAGFIMADVKLEFGRDEEGRVVLADSIGPDEFRLWPAESYKVSRMQESYDKQVIRDWLNEVGYKKSLDDARKNGSPLPDPPTLPAVLVSEAGRRYVEAYERLTDRKF
ncbi:MAG TPA: phosphoribosylaminoimidazolesuccinocarboxamide synthase [Nitrososphaerales archaeon]|nr:phosphoribosylaminoimidazolesuccinocarboxamide synthase [Nitrososphaerales archaeon]